MGQASIARDKANLVEGTKTSLRAMQLKLKREGELKERIAAFAVFNKNAEKAKKLSANLQARVRLGTNSHIDQNCGRVFFLGSLKIGQTEKEVCF